METQVFKNGDLARLEGIACRFCIAADAVADELHLTANDLGELVRHGLQAELSAGCAFRTAEVRNDDDACPAVGEILYAGNDTLKARGVCDATVLEGDVEIGPHEDALATDIGFRRRLQVLEIHLFPLAGFGVPSRLYGGTAALASLRPP